jgi:hypothetical protein
LPRSPPALDAQQALGEVAAEIMLAEMKQFALQIVAI